MTTLNQVSTRSVHEQWLTRYYLTRAAVSVAWVVSALTFAQQNAALSAVWLVLYPFWDAAANYVDAARNGGLAQNRTQTTNVVISFVTGIAVLLALQTGLQAVLFVYGVWAIVSGVLQLATAVRRWRSSGAQWAMILSGGQSALAGAFFLVQSQQPVAEVLPTIAGYAGFGALYFMISAIALLLGTRLRLKEE
jgi:uncharacterized membrane protein HdeD (DUF308 family)